MMISKKEETHMETPMLKSVFSKESSKPKKERKTYFTLGCHALFIIELCQGPLHLFRLKILYPLSL